MTRSAGATPERLGELEDGRSAREGDWVYAVVLVAAATAASMVMVGPTIAGYFQADDLEMIWRATAFDPAMPSLGYPSNHWRPMVDLSISVNHGLGGLDPLGYRVFNALAHIAAAITVGVLVAVITPSVEGRGRGRSDRWSSVLAAVCFAVWPSHGEAALWIAGRGDLLMTLFGLWAVVAAALAARGPVAGGPANERRPAWSWVAALMLVLALLSKESAVAVPFIATVVVWSVRRSAPTAQGRGVTIGSALSLTWPMYAATAVWFAWRRVAMGSFVGGFAPAWEQMSPAMAARGVGALVLRSALPPLPLWGIAAAVSVVAVALTSIVVRRRRSLGGDGRPAGSVGDVRAAERTSALYVVCALLAVVPVAGLGASLTSAAGERLAYLPSAFVIAALVRWWAVASKRWPRVAVAAAALVVVVLGASSLQMAHRWSAAAEESQRVSAALGVLPTDGPALVLGARERDRHGIPVALNSMGAAVVLLHGWTDPSLISDSEDWPLPGGEEPTVWDFDGTELVPRRR